MLEGLNAIDWKNLDADGWNAEAIRDHIVNLTTEEKYIFEGSLFELQNMVAGPDHVEHDTFKLIIPFAIDLLGENSIIEKHRRMIFWFVYTSAEIVIAEQASPLEEFVKISNHSFELLKDRISQFSNWISSQDYLTRMFGIKMYSLILHKNNETQSYLKELLDSEKNYLVRACILRVASSFWRDDPSSIDIWWIKLFTSINRSNEEAPLVRFVAFLATLYAKSEMISTSKIEANIFELIERCYSDYELICETMESSAVYAAISAIRILNDTDIEFRLLQRLCESKHDAVRKDSLGHFSYLVNRDREKRHLFADICKKLLLDDNSEVRHWAACYLAEIGASAKTAENELISSLNDVSSQCRRQAALALGRMGSEKAVSGIIKQLYNPETALWALRAIAKLGTKARESLPHLQLLVHRSFLPDFRGLPYDSLLRDVDFYWSLARAIASLKEEDDILPEILIMIENHNTFIYGFYMLNRLNNPSGRVFDYLLTLLKSTDSEIRIHSARTISNLSKYFKMDIQFELQDFTRDFNDIVKFEINSALWKVTGYNSQIFLLCKEEIRRFRSMNDDAETCARALEIISELGIFEPEIMEIIESFIQTERIDNRVLYASLSTYWKITKRDDLITLILKQGFSGTHMSFETLNFIYTHDIPIAEYLSILTDIAYGNTPVTTNMTTGGFGYRDEEFQRKATEILNRRNPE